MAEILAETVLFAERASSGKRRRIVIRIGLPRLVRTPTPNYKCRLEIRGVMQARYIWGIDAMQAIILTVRFLHDMLVLLRREDWRFYGSMDGSDRFDPNSVWFGPRKGRSFTIPKYEWEDGL